MEKKEYIRDGRAPIPEKELTSRIMSAIKDKNTKPEVLLRKGLWKEGIRGYRIHLRNTPGRTDIAFTKKKIAIYVNGCFWHRCPYCAPSKPRSNTEIWEKKFQANIDRDARKREELLAHGWKVMTLWKCEIKKNLQACIHKIKQVTS